MPNSQKDDLRSNQLFGALEAATRKRIQPHLQSVTLKLGAVVCEAAGVLEHAYFPQSSVLSLLTVLENGSAIETANIGYEGAFGLFEAMYGQVSFNRCIVQMEGRMVRCPIEVLHNEFRKSEQARALFLRDLDVAGDAVVVFLVDQGADRGRLVERVAEHQRFGRGLIALAELVENRTLHEQAWRGQTHLALV